MIKVSDTKSKIISVAHELFAKFGFHGTSIRDICTQADVNVASINYHFKNKENLYFETYLQSYKQMDEAIEEISRTSKDTADLAWKAFEHMINNGPAIVNAFKIMLDSNVEMPVEHLENSQKNFGPPGGNTIIQSVSKDLPEASEMAKIWAVRSIFTYIAHWALMMNTNYCSQMRDSGDPEFSMEAKERNIKRQVEATLEYIRNHPEEF